MCMCWKKILEKCEIKIKLRTHSICRSFKKGNLFHYCRILALKEEKNAKRNIALNQEIPKSIATNVHYLMSIHKNINKRILCLECGKKKMG